MTELPGSIEKSSIRPRPDWQASIAFRYRKRAGSGRIEPVRHVATIRLDALQFTRLAGGRPMCPARGQDVELAGDKDLAARIVEGLNFVI